MTRIERNARRSFRRGWLVRPFALVVLLVLLVLLGLLLVAPTLGLPVLAQSGAWVATFDGAPSSPQQYDPPPSSSCAVRP